ncbi:MAG: fluoride efflux transporter CrcB [Bacillota bacterium]
MNIVAVGIGGFFGAILRYIVGERLPIVNGFPLGTFMINLLGCLFLGWFLNIKWWKINPNLKLAIGTGFVGAFTTFSTFSVETLYLLKNHHFFLALFYVMLSVLGGIGLAAIGAKLASKSVQIEGGKE